MAPPLEKFWRCDCELTHNTWLGYALLGRFSKGFLGSGILRNVFADSVRTLPQPGNLPEMHLWVLVLGQPLHLPFHIAFLPFCRSNHASVQPSLMIIVICCSGLEKLCTQGKGTARNMASGHQDPLWVLCVPQGPAQKWSWWWEASACTGRSSLSTSWKMRLSEWRHSTWPPTSLQSKAVVFPEEKSLWVKQRGQ